MILTKTVALTLIIALAVFVDAQRRPRRGRGNNPEAQALKKEIRKNILAKIAIQYGVSTPATNDTNPTQTLVQAIRLKKLQEIVNSTAAEVANAAASTSTSESAINFTGGSSNSTSSSPTNSTGASSNSTGSKN
ncbi:uncharacterized protein LOC6042532 [Culex quinquefasciatus]|uniref:uncharacterized protein LOC6042532 n=1 Tax=Culex quinquefasciatus TaxID=7176 RepID=UPI0018E36B96|nr:uncharacterized protein LOC6042532 [Culex quinquefasciatus]